MEFVTPWQLSSRIISYVSTDDKEKDNRWLAFDWSKVDDHVISPSGGEEALRQRKIVIEYQADTSLNKRRKLLKHLDVMNDGDLILIREDAIK